MSSSAVVNSTPLSRQALVQAATRSSSRPRAASSTKRTRRPRRRKPWMAASSQTSVATPKTTISSGSSAARSASVFGFVKTSKFFFRSRSSRLPPISSATRPGGNGTSENGNGSDCFVSGTFSAPGVPRRQCGGNVLRKSGSRGRSARGRQPRRRARRPPRVPPQRAVPSPVQPLRLPARRASRPGA
jgi:hypothetical protein